MRFITREEWLINAMELTIKDMTENGYPVDRSKVRISCGFPTHKNAIGEVWSEQSSTDGTFEIFISPLLDDPIKLLETTRHELVHIAVGLDKKHGPVFKAAAVKLGLRGKMTATEPTEALAAVFEQWVSDHLGAYPHAAMVQQRKTARQQASKIKFYSVADSNFSLWMSPSIANQYGAPLCPITKTPMLTDDLRYVF